jgi:subtilisin-like proprotein convertase family protein
VSTALTSAATSNVVTSPGTGSPNKLLYIGDGGTTPPPGGRFENTTDYAIADNATVESPVTVSGVSGNAPSALQVPVNIVHTYIGDLQVQLIAPDGTAYTLKAYGSGGSADNINTTYTVNASSEVANGTWKLRVSDNANYDTGKIDSWALQF